MSDENHVVFLPKGTSYNFTVEEAGGCIVFDVEFDGAQPFDNIISFPIISKTELFLDCEKAERAWTYKKPGYRHKASGTEIYIISARCLKSFSDSHQANLQGIKKCRDSYSLSLH